MTQEIQCDYDRVSALADRIMDVIDETTERAPLPHPGVTFAILHALKCAVLNIQCAECRKLAAANIENAIPDLMREALIEAWKHHGPSRGHQCQ